MQFNFEGDISNVNERQLEFINQVILELGFENSKILFEPVGIAGDNYAACVKRIIVEDENKKMSIIAKIAPLNEILRETMNSSVMFRNEHIMYTEVLPKLEQLQNVADISEEKKLKYARCYGSLSELPNEVILLEDLKCANFEMLDRFQSLSDECVRSVLKNFASLHSLSYVLRQKEPLTFDYYKKKLVNTWASAQSHDHIKIFLKLLEDDTIALLNNPEYGNLLRHKVTDVIDQILKLEKADNDSKYTVIHQADCWTNNIMFKFEEGKLIESIMIDYQLSKNGSPVNDLLYMIFSCTDYEMRSKHFHDWIDFYHLELENSLSSHGLKVNFIYPRDRLDADLKRYGKVMFGFCIVLASMLIRKSDDAAKLMESVQSTDEVDMVKIAQENNVSTLDEESIIRFKTKEGKLIESIMIDYQLSKNGSPVNDLLYMIFSCTDYEMRSKHIHDWIDFYHLELENSLSSHGLKVNFIYPRDRLDADLKRYGKLMFGFSIMLAGMFIRKSDDAAKIMEAMQSTDLSNVAEISQQNNVSNLDEESIIRFKTKVVGLIKSFTEFGLL